MANITQQLFGVSGTIVFPSGVAIATFKGIGGGGGGGSGAGTDPAGGDNGGGGGAGGAAVLSEVAVAVVSNRVYNVAIGAGGAGGLGQVVGIGQNGSPGGDTIVTDSVTSAILVAFRGASGGAAGTNGDAIGGPGGAD